MDGIKRTKGTLLLPEQVKLIRSQLLEKGMNQSSLAAKAEYSPTHLSRVLQGQAGISRAYAQKIYTLLGEAEELSFLVRATSEPYSRIDESWQLLYQAYSQTLESYFLQYPLERKQAILSRLEGLIEEFKA